MKRYRHIPERVVAEACLCPRNLSSAGARCHGRGVTSVDFETPPSRRLCARTTRLSMARTGGCLGKPSNINEPRRLSCYIDSPRRKALSRVVSILRNKISGPMGNSKLAITDTHVAMIRDKLEVMPDGNKPVRGTSFFTNSSTTPAYLRTWPGALHSPNNKAAPKRLMPADPFRLAGISKE
jgi:hypothetical protein